MSLSCLAFAVIASAIAGQVATSPDSVRDKTLVVWAAPQDLAQRGGSALTIEDRNDHFDGIVFGELSSGRWMAGSDFYTRSLRDQANVPPETTSPNTFVQIAIVYSGPGVTVYRNGEVISSYTAAAPAPEFGRNSYIVFGKRHRHAADNAHFAGRISDARIYSSALTREQIAALKPGVASEPSPWAWWSFRRGSAERTGRFPITELTGGARIQDGLLMLDGQQAMMVSKAEKDPPFVAETPAMPDPVPPTWLTFHLAHPGPGVGIPGDPNCAFFWKGEYHLHYIYNNKDGFSFAHVSSTDMVHWRWHPTTLTPPTVGHGMFSGTGFYTKEGKPAIIYHGQGSGRNQIQLALDDALEAWSKPWPLEPVIKPGQDASLIANWDPDCWLDGGTYYALSGGSPGSGKPPTLFKSADLHHWDYLGLFLDHDMPDVQQDEDVSCPNFFKIGGKRMLLCISHNKGCRYYIGAWKNEKFVPEQHHRMNWHGWDFFAPESVLTPDGRRVMWAWCHLEEGLPIQSAIQSLPRELSLPKDGVLRIKPLRELQSLRYNPVTLTNLRLLAGTPAVLSGATGDAVEIAATFKATPAHRMGARIYTNAQGAGGFPIVVDPSAGTLAVGQTSAPFRLKPGEPLRLRIFVDKNVIEVFANDRQAVVAACRYQPADRYMALVSEAEDEVQAAAWHLRSIYGPQRP